MDNFKRIKIYSKGIIEPKGCIIGPVLTPYKEKIDMILNLISANYHVIEVLPDNTEVVLTMSNYNKDNTVEGRKEELSKIKEDKSAKDEEDTKEEKKHQEVTLNENNQKSYYINKNKNKKNKPKDFTPDNVESI